MAECAIVLYHEALIGSNRWSGGFDTCRVSQRSGLALSVGSFSPDSTVHLPFAASVSECEYESSVQYSGVPALCLRSREAADSPHEPEVTRTLG